MKVFNQNMTNFDATNSGVGLVEQPPWMTNVTPNGQLVSVGVAKVDAVPGTMPQPVRIPNNWLPKG